MLACDAWVAQNVGAVVLAANAHLHNGDVHALAPEDVEGEDGHELEVRRPVVRGPALTHLYAANNLNVWWRHATLFDLLCFFLFCT